MASLDSTIVVRASRRDIVRIINRIPAMCSGQRTGAGGAIQAILVRLGMTALDKIKHAFLVKARGGTDEAGDRWAPLLPSTIAYNRKHPGVPFPGKKRAPFAPSWMLTEAQRKRWWKLYRKGGGTSGQGRSYHNPPRRNDMAAAKAWVILKAEGAQTLLMVYGNTKVEILRSTGVLFNSIGPAFVIGPDQPPPNPPRVKNQVFRLEQGAVVVGTNAPHAVQHHEGRGNNPQRRLWPEPQKWPSSWWHGLLEQGMFGVIDLATYLFTTKRNP
jgi:hypothetical protein